MTNLETTQGNIDTYIRNEEGFSEVTYKVNDISVQGRIFFDILLDNKYCKSLESVLSNNFVSPYSFYESMGFSSLLGETESDFLEKKGNNDYYFTNDDFDFAKKLKKYGFDWPEALKTAFYSQNFIDDGENKRQEYFDFFVNKKFGVNSANTGEMQGFNTLDCFLLLSKAMNVNIASYITKTQANDTNAIAKECFSCFDGGIINVIDDKSGFSKNQINYLKMFSEKEIFHSSKKDDIKIIKSSIVRLFSLWKNTDEAVIFPSLDSDEEVAVENIKEYLEGSVFPVSPKNDFPARVTGMIFVSVFGLEIAKQTMDYFEKKKEINRSSRYFFSLFVAYAEHLKNDGEKDIPVHFLAALNPEIDDSEIFNNSDQNF